VETELDEGFLLVDVQFPEDLSRVQEMLVLEDLLSVPHQQWKIK